MFRRFMTGFVVMGFVLSGCASIVGSTLQPVTVKTFKDDVEVAAAQCTLTNDSGSWMVTTPGSVTIKKSTEDLVIVCKKEGSVSGTLTVSSKANGGVWGNILFGGVVGAVVDSANGAGFDYPQPLMVILTQQEL